MNNTSCVVVGYKWVISDNPPAGSGPYNRCSQTVGLLQVTGGWGLPSFVLLLKILNRVATGAFATEEMGSQDKFGVVTVYCSQKEHLQQFFVIY